MGQAEGMLKKHAQAPITDFLSADLSSDPTGPSTIDTSAIEEGKGTEGIGPSRNSLPKAVAVVPRWKASRDAPAPAIKVTKEKQKYETFQSCTKCQKEAYSELNFRCLNSQPRSIAQKKGLGHVWMPNV